MTTLTVLAVTVFVLALLAIAANFVLYPSLLAIWPTRPRSTTDRSAVLPTVSMIIAVRNGGELIAAKLENALAVDYPRDRLQIVLFSDGSTDDTVAIAQAVAAQHPQVHVGHASEHRGKHLALVDAVAQATGDLLRTVASSRGRAARAASRPTMASCTAFDAACSRQCHQPLPTTCSNA